MSFSFDIRDFPSLSEVYTKHHSTVSPVSQLIKLYSVVPSPETSVVRAQSPLDASILPCVFLPPFSVSRQAFASKSPPPLVALILPYVSLPSFSVSPLQAATTLPSLLSVPSGEISSVNPPPLDSVCASVLEPSLKCSTTVDLPCISIPPLSVYHLPLVSVDSSLSVCASSVCMTSVKSSNLVSLPGSVEFSPFSDSNKFSVLDLDVDPSMASSMYALVSITKSKKHRNSNLSESLLNFKTNRNGGGGVEKSQLYPRQCEICCNIYKSKQTFFKHKKTCNENVKSKSEYPKVCEVCQKSYKSADSFGNHIRKQRCKNNLTVSLFEVYPRTCTACSREYNCRKTYNRHRRYCLTSSIACDLCNVTFSNKISFIKHKVSCAEETQRPSYFNCMFSCSKSFASIKSLNKHAFTEHHVKNVNFMTFDSVLFFHQWMEDEGATTFTSFRKLTGCKKTKHTIYRYYSCQFYVPKSKLKSSSILRNKKGTIPKHLNCPVRIYATECTVSGVFNVFYYSEHNHSLKFENCIYQPLRQSVRDIIKFYLGLSVPVKKIREILQDSAGARDSRGVVPLLKEVFISRKSISAYNRNIQKSLFHDNDAVSVATIVQQLKGESYNPILIYKPQGGKTVIGPSGLDALANADVNFALGIQTFEQKQMMIKGCSEILCIDSTHNTNQYGFYLINLLVPDEFGCGYPVAHFITNFADFLTVKCLFKSLLCKIPNLHVNCVMTDDDQVIFPAFSACFGVNMKHLLCLWHVHQSWIRQLNNKVKDKILKDEMKSKLTQILYEKSKEVFHSLLESFISRYSVRACSFIAYFKEYYSCRIELWSLSYRKFPHASTETNMYCESFHNKLKTVYFDRKFNKRVDRLLYTLFTIEKDSYLSHYYKLLIGMPTGKDSVYFCKKGHEKGMKITDSDVLKLSDSEWSVKSQTKKTKFYNVKKIYPKCPFDSCYFRCLNPSCKSLCNHLYCCNCPDTNVLCKHVHKLHSYIVRGDTFLPHSGSDLNLNFSKLATNLPALNCNASAFNPRTNDNRIAACERLASELLNLIREPKVQSTMLQNIQTSLSTLVSQCKGILNTNISTAPFSRGPKIKPNQKIPKMKLFRTSKKRKCVRNKSSNSKLCKKVDPDSSNECPSKRRKLNGNFEISKFGEDSKIEKKSFTLPISSRNLVAPVVTVNDYKLNLIELKSLDPFISAEDEKLLKSHWHDFIKGWLYDDVINAFLSKILEDNTEIMFIASTVSQCIFSGMDPKLKFPHPLILAKYLLIPTCLNSHWILFVANLTEYVFYIYDPSSISVTHEQHKLIFNLSTVLNRYLKKNVSWKVTSPPHAQMSDCSSCGVFLCYYAYQLVHNEDLNKSLNTDRFRELIYNNLVNGYVSDIHLSSTISSDSDNLPIVNLGFEDFSLQLMAKPYIIIDSIELTPYMLKSLDPFITDREEMYLQSISKCFKRGWLYDNIIDAFFLKIMNNQKDLFCVSSTLASSVGNSNLKTIKTFAYNLEKASNTKLIFIPVNIKSHWVLIIVDVKGFTFEFYDPLNDEFSENYRDLVKKLYEIFKTVKSFNTSVYWKIISPPHIKQTDNINCGVFICYYALQKISQLSLREPFDPIQFRKYILELLLKT